MPSEGPSAANLIIAAAAPAFIVLILAEVAFGLWRRRNTYRANDAVSSISLGITSQLIGVFTASIGLAAYSVAFTHLSLFTLPLEAWWAWVLTFVLYDLCYYWLHRMSHEVNFLWATHVVHHSSEEYNLSTALRQPSTGFLGGWAFYLPLAVLGAPPLMMTVCGTFNLLYQFWIHTRQIDRMGRFDRWFASPSNHRVHHGQNDHCLDRNYGGVFMVWDHLFGTFQEERSDEPIRYGIRGALQSWNPVWGNLHVFSALWRDTWLADTWKDRVGVWFRGPAWRPAAAERVAPKAPYDPHHFEPFNPQLPRGRAAYAVLQLALVLPPAVHFLLAQSTASRLEALAYAAVLIATMVSVGGVLEGRRSADRFELLRLGLLLVVPQVLGRWFLGVPLEDLTRLSILLPVLGSATWFVWLLSARPLPANAASTPISVARG